MANDVNIASLITCNVTYIRDEDKISKKKKRMIKH